MPEFGYALPDQPALDELARTDLLLDALAERRPVDLETPDDALAVLLEDWRDNLRWPPASALVSPEEAVEALRTGIADRRRSRRGLAAIGSVAATLLVLSGFGAMVVEARPGDALHGLHAMFFDQPRVNDDQIMLSAKADLAKVQQMIDQGQWTQAQNQLAEVSSTVQSMNDGASRHDLMNEVNLLNTRVESRNPNATLPAPQSKPPSAPAASTTPPVSP
ncbi:MAG TPA: anti-sigma-D factor RsdA, partial [Mycobacterium sp.]|nr:anti-sigma-D factor RsdA [Mycobacterium sp.]